MLDLAEAAARIAERGGVLGRPLHLLASTGSTNDDAKAAAREGAPHGATWVTETQDKGRGRQGRSWVSPPGENLLFSVLVRVRCPPARVPPLALVAGLAVRDAVARHVDSSRDCVRVKWPNDVVVLDSEGAFKKIAGILVESAVAGTQVEYVVVGVGLNVHTRVFPDELAAIATSVALESAAPPDRATLLADVLVALDRDLEHVARRGLGLVHSRLAAADVLRGRAVEVDGKPTGVAEGIDADGRLLIRGPGPDAVQTRVVAGEVRVRSSG
jgi:BirA family biotin operon repressor/biotin-[acetyl-CoA-carboxylase] ligase